MNAIVEKMQYSWIRSLFTPDHVRAIAFCVWVAHPTLSLLGLVNPLWSAGQLAGSPAEAMARVFSGVWVVYLIVPWRHVFRTWFRLPRRADIRLELRP